MKDISMKQRLLSHATRACQVVLFGAALVASGAQPSWGQSEDLGEVELAEGSIGPVWQASAPKKSRLADYGAQWANIKQTGEDHSSRVTQSGHANKATVTQAGTDNFINMVQAGVYNEARILQDGFANNAVLNQQAQDARLGLVQYGAGNDAIIAQQGNGTSVGVAQIGNNNRADLNLKHDYNLVQRGGMSVIVRQ